MKYQYLWLDNPNQQVKTLYKSFMPWAKPKGRERLVIAITPPSNSGENAPPTLAVVRVRPVGEYDLVTGMLVHSDYRGKGLGDGLLAFIIPDLKPGMTFLYALPHLEAYYQRAGFKTLELNSVPNDIGQLYLKYSRQKPLVLMGLCQSAK